MEIHYPERLGYILVVEGTQVQEIRRQQVSSRISKLNSEDRKNVGTK